MIEPFQGLDDWPLIARSVGLVIKAALGTGSQVDVPVDVYEDGELHVRSVDYLEGRGWVTLSFPDDPIGEDILYDGGDLFTAAFVAVTGRQPGKRDPKLSRPSVFRQVMREEVLS